MNCNLFGTSLPEHVKIDGNEYSINWDFRVGIQLDSIIRSDRSDEEKLKDMLHLYYSIIPANIQEAVNQITWFYRCGDMQEEKEDDKQRHKRRKSQSPPYVFEQDSPYIYAAFKEQYGIDITSVDNLHWWKFMALFESLDENTKMSKIMFYRRVSTSGMERSRRALINEMKKIYQIKDFSEKEKMTLEKRNQKWLDYIKERHCNH